MLLEFGCVAACPEVNAELFLLVAVGESLELEFVFVALAHLHGRRDEPCVRRNVLLECLARCEAHARTAEEIPYIRLASADHFKLGEVLFRCDVVHIGEVEGVAECYDVRLCRLAFESVVHCIYLVVVRRPDGVWHVFRERACLQTLCHGLAFGVAHHSIGEFRRVGVASVHSACLRRGPCQVGEVVVVGIDSELHRLRKLRHVASYPFLDVCRFALAVLVAYGHFESVVAFREVSYGHRHLLFSRFGIAVGNLLAVGFHCVGEVA